MRSVCIIPARGGSKRIPRKNLRLFHGKPIIMHSIELAHESDLFDAVIVSTDDYEVAEVTRRHATVVIRNWDDPDGDVGTDGVMGRALAQMGCEFGVACCLYATSPLATVDDLVAGFATLKVAPRQRYVYSVGFDGVDAGQWYWAHADTFSHAMPVPECLGYCLPSEQICDINTEDDWLRAERMYAALHGLETT